MITNVLGPEGSASTSILVCDIVRLEAHTLTLFEKKIHNLYVFVGKASEEYFHLFSYQQPQRLKLAHKQLSALLKEKPPKEYAVQITPATPTPQGTKNKAILQV